MSNRVVVRSDTDNHVLFTAYKAYYPDEFYGDLQYVDHKHTELEISAIMQGCGTYNCSGIDYDFSPGSVFFHCGNDIHYFSHIKPGNALSLIALRFEPRFIWSPGGQWFDQRYLKIFMMPEQIGRSISDKVPAARIIRTLLEEIFQECRDHGPSYDLLVKAKLMTILANMARHFHDKLESDSQPSVNIVHLAQMERSMNYLLKHLKEPLTLEQLAREATMSRSQYSTLFKSLNGVSVWDYITHQRINLALYQLEHTDDPITKICGDSGYNNIANFNRMFKKITGKTPREYRMLMRPADRTDKPFISKL